MATACIVRCWPAPGRLLRVFPPEAACEGGGWAWTVRAFTLVPLLPSLPAVSLATENKGHRLNTTETHVGLLLPQRPKGAPLRGHAQLYGQCTAGSLQLVHSYMPTT